MQFNVAWSDLKAFATARDAPVQWIVINGMYNIAAMDGPMEVACTIPLRTPTPPNSDQYDFETNYKTSGNASPRGNIVQVLGKDELSLCPFGAANTNVAPNTVTVWDIEVPATVTLRGASFYTQNAVIGDWISLEVIDKNNVVGYGGTPENPTILGKYAISWYVIPGQLQKVEDVSISQTLPQGVFIRINYTSTGTSTCQAVMNFISYVGI